MSYDSGPLCANLHTHKSNGNHIEVRKQCGEDSLLCTGDIYEAELALHRDMMLAAGMPPTDMLYSQLRIYEKGDRRTRGARREGEREREREREE